MPGAIHSAAVDAALLAPRWSWRAVLLAAALTICIFLLLPFLETLTAPPAQDLSLRSADTAVLAPPPPPPPPRARADTRPPPPKPELELRRQRLTPLQAAMNLTMAMGDIGGDFALDFGLSSDALGDQMERLVFELGELDEPPRPLARLQPLYPVQARMRRIEGYVELEWVVEADGTTTGIEVVASHPAQVFTAAAMDAIRRWRFTPGTRNGRSVAVRVRQRVEFKLN